VRTHTGRQLGRVAPAGLVDATLQLHWAVQHVAAAGQTFVEPVEDDSHRAMTWDRDHASFVGAPFACAYPFRVAVRPEDLSFLILDRRGDAVATMPLGGATREDAFAWLRAAMATYLGGPPPHIERPEWDMPEHPVGRGAPFSSSIGDELAVLADLYGTAADLIEEVTAGRSDASEVRCWPHHFDIASLVTLERDAQGRATKTVGIGLAPMGGGYESWYWYVSPWPYPEPNDLPELSAGEWHTEGWTGAVLSGDAIVALSEGERLAAIRAFLAEAFQASLDALR
jgi:hypothetical protein